jgi:1,4-dihydroxy-2-naphthoate octaprenyltransferase
MINWLKVWFKAARAPFLVVSFIPCLVGGAMAYSTGSFDWMIFITVTIGIVMAHSAGDFIDDYFDFKTGNLGNKEKQFHDSPLIDQKVTAGQVLFAFLLCMAIALACGIYLLFTVGMPVITMTLIGAFIVLFYTSPPLKLNYRGLGETMLFIAFGPLIVFGVYYVLTGNMQWEPIIAGIPLGIFTMNVGLVSNTFDYFDDVESNKKAIPVRFGQANAVKFLRVVLFISYIVIVFGVVAKMLPVWTLISLLPLPLSLQVVKATSKYEDTSNYTPAMTKAIALTSVTGLLMFGAYVIEILI